MYSFRVLCEDVVEICSGSCEHGKELSVFIEGYILLIS
jgi:hypothetical protein